MEEALTIKEVAKLLNLSYNTVHSYKEKWGFFQMEGSRVWRIYKSDLDLSRKKKNNVMRLVRSTDLNEERKCRSTKEMACIGSILQHQAAKELDRLLGPL